MKALALETSGAAGSLALGIGDDVLERVIATPRQQAAAIVGLVDELLGEAGLTPAALDAIVVGRGPGSFTGLRMAVGVAQGLAMAAGLGVVPVSSLAGLAQTAWREAGAARTLVLVDARMGELYAARFEIRDGLAAGLGDERLLRPEAVEPPPGRWTGVGDAFAAYAESLDAPIRAAAAVHAALAPAARDLLPLAAAALERGLAVRPETISPVYLRDRGAWSRHART